jgi:predicted RecB family nuclease
MWAGTRPYQSLPFQWSCHIEQANGDIDHAEFLDRSGEPPMRLLAEALLATLGNRGPIFSYTGFEKGVISGLSDMFPDLSASLRAVVGRLVDLHKITKEHYYHPAMRGSWSLKAVLPTVAPDLRYDALDEVQHGYAAGLAYLEVIDAATDTARRDELIDALLEYCKLDTLALVRLARFLQQQKISAKGPMLDV